MKSYPLKSRALRARAACGIYARLMETGRASRDQKLLNAFDRVFVSSAELPLYKWERMFYNNVC